MAFTEEKIIANITPDRWGNINVAWANVVKRDGEEIARTIHMELLTPDSDISIQPKSVKALTKEVWTPEVVAAFKARKEEQEALARNPDPAVPA